MQEFVPTVVMRDPRTLTTYEFNVRQQPGDLDDLVASIAAHGVLEPLLITPDGAIVAGNRRALAAVAVGLAEVPCIVRDTEGVSALRMSLTENNARRHLTPVEEADSYLQLAAFGVGLEEIAASSARSGEQITRAIEFAKTKRAKAVVEAGHPLTFDQAMALAEFEKDKETLDRLAESAADDPDEFPFQLADARARRRAADLVAEKIAELGVPKSKVLADRPRAYGFNGPWRLDDLTDENGGDLTLENHKACPGHRVWVHAYVNDEAAEVVAYCVDIEAAGHKQRQAGARGGRAGQTSAPLSDIERQQRSERRRLNAEWKTVTRVRREWIKGFVGSTTVRKEHADAITKAFALRAVEGSGPMRPSTLLEIDAYRAVTGTTETKESGQYDYLPAVNNLSRTTAAKLPQQMLALLAAQVDGFNGPEYCAYPQWYALLKKLGYKPAAIENAALKASRPARSAD